MIFEESNKIPKFNSFARQNYHHKNVREMLRSIDYFSTTQKRERELTKIRQFRFNYSF